jgi:tripeptidyl-peptidase-1
MHFSPLITVLHAIGALYSCYGSPVASRSSYAVAENHPVPNGWTKVGPAPKSTVIKLQIGLKQGNEGVIEQHLLQVSDPKHPRYGQHLSTSEVHNIIKPSDDTDSLVRSWLADNNITAFTYSPAKDWVSMPLTVGQVESLLQTEYYVFVHNDGTTVVRAPEWSLPLYLHEHVDVVQPTTSFFRPMEQAKSLVLDGEGHDVSWWEAQGAKLSKVSSLYVLLSCVLQWQRPRRDNLASMFPCLQIQSLNIQVTFSAYWFSRDL